MSVLHTLAGATKIWRWTDTHQRAFDGVKKIVGQWRDHHRKALDYSPGAPPIFLATDGCLTGESGYVAQGATLETAEIVTFWSGKFN